MRRLTVNTHDMSIGLWQEDANDPSFREEIFKGVLTFLRRRGWKVWAEPGVHRSIAKDFKLAERGTLRCAIRVSGRVVEMSFWATTWPLDNRHGPRHDFDKLERLTFLDRMRFEQLHAALMAWLRPRAELDGDCGPRGSIHARPGSDRRIAAQYEKNWHNDPVLERPVPKQAWEDRSADGRRIVHGDWVWYRDRQGRLRRAQAFFRNSTTWMMRENDKVLVFAFTSEILVDRPADVRGKDNAKLRRKRLEGEMTRAAGRGDFVRAQMLKGLLFGAEDLWMIWANDKRAYYGPLYSGYVDDPILAGKYTRAEAMKEVERVPHELEAVAPDGTRVSARVREVA